MKQQLLLLKDVIGLGRSGDVVTANPGYTRNFLLPQKKAVIAGKQTLKMQTRLKEDREKRAAVDRKEGEEMAAKLAEVVISIEVKADPEGKMYGSVTSHDIARLMQEKGHQIERKNIVLPHPIKILGKHIINLKLREGVPATFTLEVTPEGGPLPISEKKEEEAAPEEPKEEAAPEEPKEDKAAL